MMHRHIATAILIWAAVAAQPSFAHSVGWGIEPDTEAIVLSFAYGGGDPMAFAEVTITAPDGQVYQKGRADRAGKFAVVAAPEVGDGSWTATVVDGEGHRLTATFDQGSEEQVSTLRAGLADAIGLTALFLLLTNIVTLAYFWGRVRPAIGEAPLKEELGH
jgi:hypothetical protein